MATANDILRVARAEIGYKESPSGSNKTKYGKEYGLNGQPWCAIFVWWVCKHAGDVTLFCGGKKDAYCPTIADYYIAKKQTVSKSSGQGGDIVLFNFGKANSQHIGFIEKKNSDGSYTCIEGNTSVGNNCNGGMVMRRTRYKSQISWIVRPKFKEEKPIPKPTGKYSGTVPKGLYKNGSKGEQVKQLQNFLNWYGADCGKADGDFGTNTYDGVCAFQRAEGLEVDGTFGSKSYAKAIGYVEKKAEGYGGEFPDFVIHSRNYLQQIAKELAWPKGTKASKYNYKGGSPVAKFKTALNKAYPNRSGWGAKSKAGASCDVFVGTVLRYSGCDTSWARGLDGQYGRTPKHCSTTSNIKEAQMVIYSGHTRMIVDIGGVKYNCEANHNYKGGQYGHIGSKASKPVKSKLKMFKVTSAFRAISFGDLGSEVTKLQKFLNWAGYDCGTPDGDFGDKTLGAVKSFQYDNGLTSDGEFGSKSLAKAKEIKK